MNRIIVFLKKKDLYLGFSRYSLGLLMITYAVTKILRTQFVVIPFSVWQRPLESLSGRSLAWAFLGYSPWFQIMLGFFELVPALLLLFRRTTLLGGILLLPMTLSVFLVNHALSLWDDTKLISLTLLCLNCIVLLFQWKKLKEIILIVIGKGLKFKFSVVEILVNLVLASLVTWFITADLLGYKHQTNVLTGDWYNKRPNEWILQSEKTNDSTLHHRLMKSYFGAYGEYSEINDTGYVKRNTFFYDIDEKTRQLKFYNNKNKLINKCTYSLLGDTALRVEKTIDSTKDTKVVQVFKRRIINERSGS